MSNKLQNHESTCGTHGILFAACAGCNKNWSIRINNHTWFANAQDVWNSRKPILHGLCETWPGAARPEKAPSPPVAEMPLVLGERGCRPPLPGVLQSGPGSHHHLVRPQVLGVVHRHAVCGWMHQIVLLNLIIVLAPSFSNGAIRCTSPRLLSSRSIFRIPSRDNHSAPDTLSE